MFSNIKTILLIVLALCVIAVGISEAAMKYTFKPTLFLGEGSYDIATNPGGVTVAAWGGGGDWDAYKPLCVQRYNANGIPIGNLIRIVASQYMSISNPAVDIDVLGGFAVAYRDYNQSLDLPTISASIYDANGKFIKKLPVIPNDVYYDVDKLDLSMDANGNFVVTWAVHYGNDLNIRARRFDAQGNPTTDVFDVAASVGDKDSSPHIAMNGAGDFAIVYQRSRTADCVDTQYSKANQCDDVLVQRFNSQAVPQGNVIVVSDGNKSLDQAPDIAMDDEGNFVVVWQHFRDLCQGMLACDDIVAKRYNSAGKLVGNLNVVADYSNADTVPRIVMAGQAKFVVMWSRIDPSPDSVLFHAYDAAGLNLTAKAVNITDGMSTSSNDNSVPAVGISDKGVINVIWGVSLPTSWGDDASALLYRRLIPSTW